jgi:hypothetical protein
MSIKVTRAEDERFQIGVRVVFFQMLTVSADELGLAVGQSHAKMPGALGQESNGLVQRLAG